MYERIVFKERFLTAYLTFDEKIFHFKIGFETNNVLILKNIMRILESIATITFERFSGTSIVDCNRSHWDQNVFFCDSVEHRNNMHIGLDMSSEENYFSMVKRRYIQRRTQLFYEKASTHNIQKQFCVCENHAA